jgi:tetratricopeptide (TPR) repeat protein
MKKKGFFQFVLLSTIFILFISGFPGCQKLKTSNLRANYHFNKANDLYREEKYKNAIKEYEETLKLNPDLNSAYIYLGTCYSQIYHPGKNNPGNKEAGEKAIRYLMRAKEAFPDEKNVIYALSEIYDKMGNFEESEKYLKMILEKEPNNPVIYYVLADIYSKYNKRELSESMFEKRISLDPGNPEGYHYYSNYLANMHKWDEAIGNGEKRVYAIHDPGIIPLLNDVGKMKSELEIIEAIESNIKTIRKHTKLTRTEKDRLLKEAKERLQKFQSKEEMSKEIARKEKEMKKRIGSADKKIAALSEDSKKEIIDALYTLGYICWEKLYHKPTGIRFDFDVIDKGMAAIHTVLELDPKHDSAMVCLNLLWRQKCIGDPLKCKEYLAKAEALLARAKRIRERRVRNEKIKRQLENMGYK